MHQASLTADSAGGTQQLRCDQQEFPVLRLLRTPQYLRFPSIGTHLGEKAGSPTERVFLSAAVRVISECGSSPKLKHALKACPAMKRKHYPIATVVVATLLTVVPLFLLSLALPGNSIDSELASEESRDHNLLSSATVQQAASPVPIAAITDSRINAVNDDRSVTPVPPLIAEQRAAASGQVSGQPPSLLPEPPVPIPSSPTPGNDVPESAEAVVSQMPETPLAPALLPTNFPQPTPVVADMGVVDLPARPDAGASYYEATGHLALRTQAQVPDPLANRIEPSAPPKDAQAPVDAGEVTSERSRKSKSRRSTSEEKRPDETVSDLAKSDPRPLADLPRSGTKASADDDAFVEEVVIQTPVESALVSRVENVVAMTGARGWPIALVRSDLPDDVWWVQQVVGIQGNAFAARVNFGNEYSLSGSTFSMVIVFLDSPDEVRRFRIAKQFKDIPEGVRRSREFHYIRN